MKIIDKRTKIILIILGILILLCLPGLYNKMKVVCYDLSSGKVASTVRIALVTDLHSCRYGDGAQELIDAIDEQSPDVILLGGDIFDDKMPNDNSESFIQGISGRYDVYYVTGNHEYWSEAEKFEEDLEILSENGITRLQGDMAVLDIGGTQIAVAGIDDPDLGYLESGDFDMQLQSVTDQVDPDIYTILLTHRPELYDDYQGRGFDLILAGHAHGGQWRVPGLINGIFAPNQGLFPGRAGGYYDDGDTPMIVSRGLARESTMVPRLYNRPELVIVEIS